MEELAAGEKEASARMATAAGRLGDVMRTEVERSRVAMKGGGGGGGGRAAMANNVVVAGRVGPILARGTGLSAAMEALEDYYSGCAEGASERWRTACTEQRPLAPGGGGGGPPPASSSIEMQELTADGKEVTDADDDEEQWRERRRRRQRSAHGGLLPKLRTASAKAAARASERERALTEIRSRFSEANDDLRSQKEWAASRWRKVADEESDVDRRYAARKLEQHERYEEERRRQQESAFEELVAAGQGGEEGAGGGTATAMPEEAPLSKEVWDMVQDVANFDGHFGHTGYSPKASAGRGKQIANEDHATGRIWPPPNLAPSRQQGSRSQQQQRGPPPRLVTRADVERESDLPDLRTVARAADESVEDAAGKLLNVMSEGDTTLRSARLAAESCLLSECNAMRDALASLAALERASLEDRARRLEVLERAVEAVDVRRDIHDYVANDKRMPGGRSSAGEDDGGGIAAALAVLNSHAGGNGDGNDGANGGVLDAPRKYGNIERPSHFEGWGEEDRDGSEDRDDDVEPEVFGDAIRMLFEDGPGAAVAGTDAGNDGAVDAPRTHESIKDEKVERACDALAKRTRRGRSSRKSILYELNNQRSKKTRAERGADFRSLCRLFNAFLSGCGRESADVSDAKMLMILSQTFYFVEDEKGKVGGGGRDAEETGGDVAAAEKEGRGAAEDRERRVYVKSEICHSRAPSIFPHRPDLTVPIKTPVDIYVQSPDSSLVRRRSRRALSRAHRGMRRRLRLRPLALVRLRSDRGILLLRRRRRCGRIDDRRERFDGRTGDRYGSSTARPATSSLVRTKPTSTNMAAPSKTVTGAPSRRRLRPETTPSSLR